MNQIKFSNLYRKIVGIQSRYVRLIEVMNVNLEDLSKPFLDYDTDCGKYRLPKRGKYLMLIFEYNGHIFTTLRSAYPQSKVKYYRQAIGEAFELLIDPI